MVGLAWWRLVRRRSTEITRSQIQECPANFDGLEELHHFRYPYSDGTDVDATHLIKKKAVTCYLIASTSEITDWLMLLDDFFNWRNKEDNDDRMELPSIVVHNRSSVKLVIEDASEFSCPIEFLSEENGGSEAGDVRVVDVPPPVYPKRNVVITLAAGLGQNVDLTITGNCKPFANGFSAKRITCKSLKRSVADAYYEKFYVLHEYKVETNAHIDFLLKDIITGVLKNAPIAWRVEGNFTGTSAELRDRLQALSNVYPCA